MNKKANDERFRVLFEKAPEAVLILDVSTKKFIDFNQKALDLFQLTNEEMVGKGPIDLSPKTNFWKPCRSFR